MKKSVVEKTFNRFINKATKNKDVIDTDDVIEAIDKKIRSIIRAHKKHCINKYCTIEEELCGDEY